MVVVLAMAELLTNDLSDVANEAVSKCVALFGRNPFLAQRLEISKLHGVAKEKLTLRVAVKVSLSRYTPNRKK